LSPNIISGTGIPSFFDISSIAPDLEIGNFRALILKPFWVCETVDCSAEVGVGKGSLIAPLRDMVAGDGVDLASFVPREKI
jgi:hypothetical protein